MNKISIQEGVGQVWMDRISDALNRIKSIDDANSIMAIQKFHDHLYVTRPDLWRCTTGITMSGRDTDALLSGMENGFGRKQRRLMQYMLRRGLTIGNDQQIWKCALSPFRKALRTPPQLFSEQDFARLPTFRKIEAAFNSRLKTLPFNDCLVSTGAIIFSIVSNSRIIDRQWLLALLDVDHYKVGGGPAGIRIELIHPKNPRKRRSVLLDPQTTFLFLSHACRYGLPLKSALPRNGKDRLLNDPLSALGVSLSLSKGDVRLLANNLVSMARPAVFQRIPSYAYGCAIARYAATSLPSSTMSRILEEEWQKGELPVRSRISEPMPAIPNPRLTIVASDQTGYARRVYQLLAQYAQPQQVLTAGMVSQKILALRKNANLLPIDRLLTDWALAMIAGDDEASLEPPSIARYFSAVWKILLASADDEDITSFDESAYLELYDEALSICSRDSSRHYAQGVLMNFHRWLEKTRSAPEVDFTELDNYTTSVGAVNANLISPSEFYKTLARIDDPSYIADEYLREACALIFILLFRCGFRKREVLKLQVRDFREFGHVIKIRPSEYGSVKSRQSIRNLPLLPLLEGGELSRLVRWHSKRSEHANRPGTDVNLLFPDQANPRALINERKVLSLILKAVREVCQDDTIVIHTLRHSFANWSLLRLQIASGEVEPPTECAVFRDPVFSVDSCKTFRVGLYNFCDEGIEDNGRRDLYCVTAMMGHLSPATTLRSYVHLIDLVTRFSHPETAPDLDIDTLANIVGFSHQMIRHEMEKHGIKRGGAFNFVLKVLCDVVLTNGNQALTRLPHNFLKRLYTGYKKRRLVSVGAD